MGRKLLTTVAVTPKQKMLLCHHTKTVTSRQQPLRHHHQGDADVHVLAIVWEIVVLSVTMWLTWHRKSIVQAVSRNHAPVKTLQTNFQLSNGCQNTDVQSFKVT